MMIRTYYLLTKPGIIMGNAITTGAAFFLASGWNIDFGLFLATVSGLGLIIASACVFNNYIDRESDRKMARTKQRALAKGTISLKSALLFATILGILGISTLTFCTNLLAVSIASLGFFVYVVLYSFWKYQTRYATLVGSIAGAIPPIVGYCAASNRFDAGAAILFLILVFWQMPHFFSIAAYRLEEYSAASIPVLPAIKGMHATKVQMALYIVGFILATIALAVFGYTGYFYLVVSVGSGLLWLGLCLKGFKTANDYFWARKMFRWSLLIITAICVMMSIDRLEIL